MRIGILPAALIAFASMAGAADAQAQRPVPSAPGPEESRLGPLSRCMAYYAVLGGMDGNTPVNTDTAAVVKDLGTELYLEANKYNVPEETIHNAVVAALVTVNMSAREEGMDKVRSAMDAECENLVGQVRGMP